MMKWTVHDVLQGGKPIGSFGTIRAAQYALHIFTAHEVKCGRKAHYEIRPPVIEACPPTWEELELPDWAIKALEEA